MRLTCPSCAAEYEIDPAAIGARGRTVRCAHCATEWLAAPQDDDAAPASNVAGAAAAVDAAARNAAREREARRERARESGWDSERGSGRDADWASGRETVIPPEPKRAFATPEPEPIEGEPAAGARPGRAGRPDGAQGAPERPARGMEPDAFTASLRAEENADRGPRAGAAFLAGFATVAVLALILGAIYLKRAEIAELVPAARAPLAAYADLVDQGRATLDRLIGD